MFIKSLVAVSMAAVALGQATINTPSSLIVCQPAALSWSGGSGPYYVSILPGGQASGTPLEQLGSFTTTSTTWTVDIAAGTAVTLAITDASGVTNYSQQVTILAGTSTSCVGKGSAAAGANTSATAPAGTTAASVVSTGAATGSAARTPIVVSSKATSATSAAAGATSAAASKASSAGSAASSAASSGASAAASSAHSSAGVVGTSGFLAFLGAVFALVA